MILKKDEMEFILKEFILPMYPVLADDPIDMSISMNGTVQERENGIFFKTSERKDAVILFVPSICKGTTFPYIKTIWKEITTALIRFDLSDDPITKDQRAFRFAPVF